MTSGGIKTLNYPVAQSCHFVNVFLYNITEGLDVGPQEFSGCGPPGVFWMWAPMSFEDLEIRSICFQVPGEHW